MTSTLSTSSTLDRADDASLIDQIVRFVEGEVAARRLVPGSRMPSIRRFASAHGVSRATVVTAYDRLVAAGRLESRRGSGFYVREPGIRPPAAPVAPPPAFDVTWLIRSMFHDQPAHRMPGSGMLPSAWHAPELLAGGLRAVSRQAPALMHYGMPQGYLPLRQQVQRKLAELGVAAGPEQVVTTLGVTQGLGLVARALLAPGDTVLVDDPAWFLMFGSFATLGLRVVGVPRLADGPDVDRLAELCALYRPKLFVLNSILHNPTSGSLSAAKAYAVLRLAEQFDFVVVEDDVYCDLHPGPGALPHARVCALDQLRRTVYVGGFAKTLAGSVRVGFLAANADLALRLSDEKMLRTLTTPEVNERVVYEVLREGHYRKQMDRLRARLDQARARALRNLDRMGLGVEAPAAGMFLWVDLGRDTDGLARRGLEAGYLFAPGSLFSPTQARSTRTRLNVACMGDPGVYRFLESELARG